jgi:hypothetical protein
MDQPPGRVYDPDALGIVQSILFVRFVQYLQVEQLSHVNKSGQNDDHNENIPSVGILVHLSPEYEILAQQDSCCRKDGAQYHPEQGTQKILHLEDFQEEENQVVKEYHHYGILQEPGKTVIVDPGQGIGFVPVMRGQKLQVIGPGKSDQNGGGGMHSRCVFKKIDREPKEKAYQQHYPLRRFEGEKDDEQQVDIRYHVTSDQNVVHHEYLK